MAVHAAQALAALRAAKALEDQNRLKALAPPEPRGPRGAVLRLCERLLGIR